MAKSKKAASTPLMEQYLNIKSQYKNVILLYRMGDFYETFYEDAKTLSKFLGIALTKRAHGKTADVPLAGFPYHALDNYLPKLLNNGLRVAICEQVEDPKLAKGIVKREVVEIASPGATMSEKILDSKTNNFLLALSYDDNMCGIAIADVSTGTFWLAEFATDLLLDNLMRYQPREILVSSNTEEFIRSLLQNRVNAIITKRDDWIFSRDFAYENLVTHFKLHSLKGFGCDDMDRGISAAGAIIHYINENYKTRLEHFVKLQVLNLSQYMVLDDSTRRNLEIAEPNNNLVDTPTLLSVIDKTSTAMGGRLIKHWLQHPLLSKGDIIFRQNCVFELLDQKQSREDLLQLLKAVFDMERLLGRIVTGKANARDVINLKNSLLLLKPIKELFAHKKFKALKKVASEINPLLELKNTIEQAIIETPPVTILEGGLIQKGYNKELDELRNIADHGKDWLLNYQKKEREVSGINSLKISYNKVFGYYLEITNMHKDKVPETYIRKQTLVNAERYITPELKEWEEKILGAEEKINSIEYNIFQEIRERISDHIKDIQTNSDIIAKLDCLCSYAVCSYENDYVRPNITDGKALKIVGGRHPVVEKNLAVGNDFIANDTDLNIENQQIWIITGPNMSGKSTFLRQVGLITLMAQIGSYVPAEEAQIGIVDRIFTTGRCF